ncbi:MULTISPECIES: TonB-dependent receptor [Sphingomonas]|uniref:TonB-dependent receptor domain-containing protein n=1 Tax=Sphingomonas TaxID=13687 RepID=UPI0015EB3CD2|nr:TonB-dependent receptor [Sphingomonas sp. CGMCC 1.13658]MBA2920498.1 TonB-dependent receptor [Sphingomonas sp. CGMCC 1.13658]
MKPADLLLLAAGAWLCAGDAQAAGPRRFDIDSGRLAGALVRYGEQAGVSVGLTDQRIARRHTRGVQGLLTSESALRHLLAGTGATYQFLDDETVRIVAAPSRRANLLRPVLQAEADAVPEREIVVTASKQAIPLAQFPGSVARAGLDLDRTGEASSAGTQVLVGGLPTLSSTHLGPGRDKLFVRGIADSSFNGPTPATVAQYFGDVRLNYAAPDPDLNLYDIAEAEVLEGPQGTLYGSAALGGIVRLIPRVPKLGMTEGSGIAGLVQTEQGGTGGDAAAMLNLPLGADIAIRAVGYGARDPGYIDDIGRGLTDVNRTTSYGGRIAIRYAPTDRLTIDAGAVLQNLGSRDSQYAERGLPPLTRNSAIAQPFDNDYRLAYLTVATEVRGAQLTSTTGFVRHDLETVFDASPQFGTRAAYLEDLRITLLTHETRISGGDARGFNWVAGVSALHNVTRAERQVGPDGAAVPLLGVKNDNGEAALFGQASVPLLDDVTLTLGARLNYDEASGQVIGDRVPERSEPKRRNLRWLPMSAIAWRPSARWLFFAHYQEGFRAGGLSITGPMTADKFRSDSIAMVEAGFRFGDADIDRFAASVTASGSWWKRIQADLIRPNGLPFTTNIGDGHVLGLEAQADWRPTDAVSLQAALFLNTSALDEPSPAFADAEERDLPNVAEAGGRLGIVYRHRLSDRLALSASGSVRYVGHSRLGIGAPVDVRQGGFAEATLSARIGSDRAGLSLSVANLTNVRGNRFAFGNPFAIEARDQVTPLRPRTFRIAIDGRF